METIRNYLEAMFANLPNTPDVLRAKDELLQMMEDKYSELIAEGKSENEAVGTVISEFGNLDELAEGLGLKTAIQVVEQQTEGEGSRRHVTMDEAKEYLKEKAAYAFCIALGVCGCIISVVGPIIFGSILHNTVFGSFLSLLGVAVMFALIGISVFLFIYANRRMQKWQFLKTEPCTLDYATTNYVIDEQKRFHSPGMTTLTIGIVACAVGWIPGALIEELLSIFVPFDLGFITGSLLFLFEGAGVFLIVYSSIMRGRFEDLLHLNDKKTVSGAYKNKKRKSTGEPVFEDEKLASMMSLYWPTVTCIYLIWSFLTFDWARTWLIWPVAAIIRKVICKNLGIPEDDD